MNVLQVTSTFVQLLPPLQKMALQIFCLPFIVGMEGNIWQCSKRPLQKTGEEEWIFSSCVDIV